MDIKYMERAMELAELGRGLTRPNPMVGAVIVKNGKVIGEGYHIKYGGPHAEINAFHDAKEDPLGSELYVTLEPCFHYGKTPPCVDEIIRKAVGKVYIAMEDPNPLVAGKSIEKLKANGIEVQTGILRQEALKLNEVFIKYITTNLPFCTLKTAMTLDGKIATSTGDSRWVTNEASRQYVHRLRHNNSAIMVGIGTVLADDPLLTTRLNDGKGNNPIRVIVDSKGRIPLDSAVLKCNETMKTIVAVSQATDPVKIKRIEQKGAEVLIAPLKKDKVDLTFLVKALGERKIDSLLIEGGSALNFSALKEGIVDKIIAFIAPKIIGGNNAKTPVGGEGISYMKDAMLFNNIGIERFGDDIMIEGYINREQGTEDER